VGLSAVMHSTLTLTLIKHRKLATLTLRAKIHNFNKIAIYNTSVTFIFLLNFVTSWLDLAYNFT